MGCRSGEVVCGVHWCGVTVFLSFPSLVESKIVNDRGMQAMAV